jgi:hypothetical protein
MPKKFDLKKKTLSLTTVEAAFKYIGLDAAKLPDVSAFPEEFRNYMLNHFILINVVKALNKAENSGKDWEPNWDNGTWKYYPWFLVDASKSKPAGSGFSSSYFGHSYTGTDVGSRLLFISPDLALFAAEHFNKNYLINQLIIK